MTQNIHLMGRDPRTQYFLDRCSQKFGDRFDYSNFEYINAKTASEIICRIHGPFLQKPDTHLNSTQACPFCANSGRSANQKGKVVQGTPLSVDEYLSRVDLPPKYILDTSEYLGLTLGKVTLYCPDHGASVYNPQALLQSVSKCADCASSARVRSKTKPFEAFQEDANKLYNGFYLYPEQEFVNRRSKVRIVCPEHGEFVKMAQKHLSGQECRTCSHQKNLELGKYIGGYSSEFFLTNPAMAECEAYVYYLRIGDLYKIGITAKSVVQRVYDLRHKSKVQAITVLQTYKCTLREAFTLEQQILDKFSESRAYRSWSTELFSVDILSETKLSDIKVI